MHEQPSSPTDSSSSTQFGFGATGSPCFIATPPSLPDLPPAAVVEPPHTQPIAHGRDEDQLIHENRYPAASDPPQLRVAYLNAMVLSVVHHCSTEAVNSSLQAGIASLRLANGIPEGSEPIESLESVRRRLGLETDPYVLRKPICSKCFTSYTLVDIAEAESTQCTVISGRTRCKGNFWDTKLVQNTPTRVPACLICYTRIVPALRRMFMRPSFVKMLKLGKEAHASHRDGRLHDFFVVVLSPKLHGLERVVCFVQITPSRMSP